MFKDLNDLELDGGAFQFTVDHEKIIADDQIKLIAHITGCFKALKQDIDGFSNITSVEDINNNSTLSACFQHPVVYGGKLKLEAGDFSRYLTLSGFKATPVYKLFRKIVKDTNCIYLFGGAFLARSGLVIIPTRPRYLSDITCKYSVQFPDAENNSRVEVTFCSLIDCVQAGIQYL